MFVRNLKYFRTFPNFYFSSKKTPSSPKTIQREKSFDILLKKIENIAKKAANKPRKGRNSFYILGYFYYINT